MVRDLKHRYVDGLILASLHLTDAHAERAERAAAPVIVIGRPTKGTPVDTVRAYSRKGAAEAVRHLHAAGRRRIAFVNGPHAHGARRVAAPRLPRRPALLRARARRGADRGRRRLHGRAGRRAAERLLARGRPDAIFCANDLLAVGALAALRDAGLDVPGDVALVGMDNSDLSEVTWPALTTVDLGSAERARIAAELLLAPDRGSRPRARRSSASSRASSSAPRRGRQRMSAGRRSRAGRSRGGRRALRPGDDAAADPGAAADRDPQRDPARARDLPRLHRLAGRPRRRRRTSSGSTTSAR